MKKILLSALMVLVLLLSACQASTGDSTPSDSEASISPVGQTQSPEDDQASAEQTQSPEDDQAPVEQSQSPEDDQTPPSEAADLADLPDFLTNFAFNRVDIQVFGTGELAWDSYELDQDQSETVRSLLAMDQWREVVDFPETGLDDDYVLWDDAGHSLLLTDWGKSGVLALAKDGETSYLYEMPMSALEAVGAFMAELTSVE
jgi:hypothetical protein